MKQCTTLTVHPVYYRFAHHASHSGYDRLCQYFPNVIKSRPAPPWAPPERFMWRLRRGHVLYDRQALALEALTFARSLISPQAIYHVLYGENTYKHLGWMTRVGLGRLVISYHQPPQILEQWIRDVRPLQWVSAIIVLGHTQIPFFAQLVDERRVHFVPHGVDVDYFTPPEGESARHPERCLFVGSWLRDFETLNRVMQDVQARRPSVQFAVVTREDHRHLVDPARAEVMSGIPDGELLRLYQTATLLVLPLQDSVANNGLLEAMAAGLPIVTTDVGSVRDYVTEEQAILTPPGDATAMADAVVDLLDDRGRQARMAQASRAQSLRFAWPNVVDQLLSLYQALQR